MEICIGRLSLKSSNMVDVAGVFQVEQGIREGAFRPVNSLLATHLLLMTIMPAAFTSRPSGTPEEMLDEALNLFLRGVQA